MVCHCLLVETEDGLVLVDTGLGTVDLGPETRLPKTWRLMSNPQSDTDTALSHIHRLGYSPRDVRHIFVTHLDLDHAGALSDFPEATVHCYQREYDAAMSPSPGESKRYVQKQWAHQPKWQLHQDGSGDHWFGFEAVIPLASMSDELAIVPLTGHSAGHCGIAIRGRESWVLHAGDAFFHHSELLPGEEAPFLTRFLERQIENNREQRLHNQKRLQELHLGHQGEVRVICSHDPELLERAQAASAGR